MKILSILLFLALSFNVQSQTFTSAEIRSLKNEARKITIVKDKWGVPHVYTKTDAQAVFGMAYVQCEEFLKRLKRH